MLKEAFKYIRAGKVIIALLIPIFFNIMALVLGLHGMAGGAYSESLISIFFFVGNWPSILLRIPPMDRMEFRLFDWLYPRIIIVNELFWGLVGVCYSFITEKQKEKRKNGENWGG
jgi:hypothetical protein